MAPDQEIHVNAKFTTEGEGKLTKFIQNVKANIGGFKAGLNAGAEAIDVLTSKASRVGILVSAFKNFRAEFLTFLFAGIAIQRTFQNIAKSATSAFTKIMESNEMFGTAVQRLTMHWEFLKFVIGSAINQVLERLLPILLPIIQKITEWVQKNPRLTAAIIGLGIALGVLMVVGSQVALFFNGLVTLFTGPLMKSIAAMAGAGGFGSILTVLAAVTAAIIIFAALWQSNLGDIKGAFQDFKEIIFPGLESSFADMGSGMGNLWKALISLLKGETDDFGKFFGSAFLDVLRGTLKFFMTWIEQMVHGFVFLSDLIKDIFFKVILNFFIALIEKMVNFIFSQFRFLIGIASKLGNLLGFDVSSLDRARQLFQEVDFSSQRSAITNFANEASLRDRADPFIGAEASAARREIIDVVVNIEALGDPGQIADAVADILNREVKRIS